MATRQNVWDMEQSHVRNKQLDSQGSHISMMTKFHDISRFFHKFPGIIFIFI